MCPHRSSLCCVLATRPRRHSAYLILLSPWVSVLLLWRLYCSFNFPHFLHTLLVRHVPSPAVDCSCTHLGRHSDSSSHAFSASHAISRRSDIFRLTTNQTYLTPFRSPFISLPSLRRGNSIKLFFTRNNTISGDFARYLPALHLVDWLFCTINIFTSTSLPGLRWPRL